MKTQNLEPETAKETGANLLDQSDVNALTALTMIDAALLIADASHNNSLCSSGVSVQYDPHSVVDIGTPAEKLRSHLRSRGILV